MKKQDRGPAALTATATVRIIAVREAGPAWVRLTLWGEEWSTVLGDFENVDIAVSREWAADLTVGSRLEIRISAPTAPSDSSSSAALAERDAQWREAVRASGLMLSPDSDNPAWTALRALLDAAARSASEAVSGAADPE